MHRPDVFTLDYSHPLAQGLIFGLLGNRPGSSVAEDSSINAQRCAIAGDLRWTQFLGRNCLQSFSVGAKLSAMLPTIPEATPVTICWQEYALSTGLGTGYGRVADEMLGSLFSDNNLARFSVESESLGFNRYNIALSSSLQFRPTHLCAVYQPSSFAFYEDAVQRDSATGTKLGRSGAFYMFNNSSGTRTFNGIIADFCIHNRALSLAEIALLADRTDPMLGGLVREVNPVAYFDFGGASAGTDNLTAADLVTGSPLLGTPALGQVHALTATGITTSAPVIGTPALGQVHVLTANGLTVSAPVLGTPAVGQDHSLTATALVVGPPVLGTPLLTENAADVDALTAVDLVVGNPVLGTPSIGQIHVLGSDGLVTGSPVLGSPSITQIHTLDVLGLTAGVPVLGTPVLNGVITDLQIRAELNTIGSNQHAAQSFGTFDVEFQSYGTTRIELICIANFEVNELGE
jgi:hypothetical protein